MTCFNSKVIWFPHSTLFVLSLSKLLFSGVITHYNRWLSLIRAKCFTNRVRIFTDFQMFLIPLFKCQGSLVYFLIFSKSYNWHCYWMVLQFLEAVLTVAHAKGRYSRWLSGALDPFFSFYTFPVTTDGSARMDLSGAMPLS